MTDINVPVTPAQPASPTHQQLQASFNAMFGGRRNKRKALRRWLKKNGVPRPLFPTVSAAIEFKRLNYLTFLDDIMKTNKAVNT